MPLPSIVTLSIYASVSHFKAAVDIDLCAFLCAELIIKQGKFRGSADITKTEAKTIYHSNYSCGIKAAANLRLYLHSSIQMKR